MELTPTERLVRDHLHQLRVAKFSELAERLDCSTKTVQRALLKAGYFTSINHNAAFVTLADVPRFDQHGLWTYQNVHFSKHGNLQETILQLVQQSPDGCRLQQLEQLVGTHVHNHVSQLLHDGRLARVFQGRRAVYLAADAKRQAAQQQALQQAEPPAATMEPRAVDVPPGLDPITVIRVLVRLLETPDASVASVARWLQARETAVRAEQIRQIMDFYGLKKTTR